MGEPIALAGRLCPEIFSAVPHESKSVPQRLNPSSAQTITARLNPCPSFDSLFPSLSGAVGIGQPKNLIWTGVKFSRPSRTQFRFAIGSHAHTKAQIFVGFYGPTKVVP